MRLGHSVSPADAGDRAAATHSAHPTGSDDEAGVERARAIARATELPIRLSGAEAKRLAAALARLLSPDALADADAWQLGAALALRDLLSADAVCIAREPPVPSLSATGLDSATVREYEQHYVRVDYGIARQRARRLGCWTRDLLWTKEELRASEYYNDFAMPHRLKDGAGVAAFYAQRSLRLSLLYGHTQRETRGASVHERRLHLLRLARPAFEAGAVMTLSWQSCQGTLVQVVDHVSRPVALCTASGRIVHRNPELERVIGRDREVLAEIISAVARAVATSLDPRQLAPRMACDVSRTCGSWRVIGTRLEWEGAGSMPVVLVSLVARSTEPASVDVLREQYEELRTIYGLTCREMDVVRLLRHRRSNAEVARALRISEHTARHHTESVLLKLGLHSRGEVEKKIEQAIEPGDAASDGEPTTVGSPDSPLLDYGVPRSASPMARSVRGAIIR